MIFSVRRLVGLTLTTAALIMATPAAGQDFTASAGYGGGAISFGEFNAGGTGQALELDAGWVVTGHIDYWAGSGRVGGRLNGAFTQRQFDAPIGSRDLSAWIVGADLLVRLLNPVPGRTVAPFLAAGVGFADYGLGKGQAILFPDADALYPGDSDRQFTVSGGVGIDIIPGFTIFGSPSGFRLEAIDHIALDSPFSPPGGGSFDPIHNVRVSLSIVGFYKALD